MPQMETISELQDYRYRGARVMILLHDLYLREFVAVWRTARDAGLPLPATDDPSYQSYDALLIHLLRASRMYINWICAQLQLPDPGIGSFPARGAGDDEIEQYLEHLLKRWREPLRDVAPEQFDLVFKARWDVEYCIDAMLEHAVMHAIRHTFQLRELLAAAGRT